MLSLTVTLPPSGHPPQCGSISVLAALQVDDLDAFVADVVAQYPPGTPVFQARVPAVPAVAPNIPRIQMPDLRSPRLCSVDLPSSAPENRHASEAGVILAQSRLTASPCNAFAAHRAKDLDCSIAITHATCVLRLQGAQSMGGLMTLHAVLRDQSRLRGVVLTSALINVQYTSILRHARLCCGLSADCCPANPNSITHQVAKGQKVWYS